MGQSLLTAIAASLTIESIEYMLNIWVVVAIAVVLLVPTWLWLAFKANRRSQEYADRSFQHMQRVEEKLDEIASLLGRRDDQGT